MKYCIVVDFHNFINQKQLFLVFELVLALWLSHYLFLSFRYVFACVVPSDCLTFCSVMKIINCLLSFPWAFFGCFLGAALDFVTNPSLRARKDRYVVITHWILWHSYWYIGTWTSFINLELIENTSFLCSTFSSACPLVYWLSWLFICFKLCVLSLCFHLCYINILV